MGASDDMPRRADRRSVAVGSSLVGDSTQRCKELSEDLVLGIVVPSVIVVLKKANEVPSSEQVVQRERFGVTEVELHNLLIAMNLHIGRLAQRSTNGCASVRRPLPSAILRRWRNADVPIPGGCGGLGALSISSGLVSGSLLAGRGGRHQYDLDVDPVAAKEFLDDLATVMSSAVEFASRGRAHGADYWFDPSWISKNREIESRVHLAQRVVQAALGEQIKLIRGSGSYGTDWEDALEYVDRARGALAHHATEQLIFEGSGPKLRADRLHPWVWDVARSAWGSGHRRLSVQAAATRIDEETKIKVDRFDISGTSLGQQVWSEKPPTTEASRLRPVGFGVAGDEDYDSSLSGARSLHAAVMSRVRNLATHSTEEIDEQIALEQLAALSLLARWIDDAEVIRADA